MSDRWCEFVFAVHARMHEEFSQENLVDWSRQFGHEPHEEEIPFFLDFLAFHHPFKDGLSPVKLCLEEDKSWLKPDDFVLNCIVSPYSIFKVTGHPEPGGYIFSDLLRKGKPHFAKLGPFDQNLFEIGSCCFAKLLADGETWTPTSIHPSCLSEKVGDRVVEKFLGDRKSCHTSTLLQNKSAKSLYQYWTAFTDIACEEEEDPRMRSLDREEIGRTRHVWSFSPKRLKWLMTALGKVEGLDQQSSDYFIFRTKEKAALGTVVLKSRELWVEAKSFERTERIELALSKYCAGLLDFVRKVGQKELMTSAFPGEQFTDGN